MLVRGVASSLDPALQPLVELGHTWHSDTGTYEVHWVQLRVNPQRLSSAAPEDARAKCSLLQHCDLTGGCSCYDHSFTVTLSHCYCCPVGAKVIRFCGRKLHVHPSFHLCLSTASPPHTLPPALLTNTAVVDFSASLPLACELLLDSAFQVGEVLPLLFKEFVYCCVCCGRVSYKQI